MLRDPRLILCLMVLCLSGLLAGCATRVTPAPAGPPPWGMSAPEPGGKDGGGVTVESLIAPQVAGSGGRLVEAALSQMGAPYAYGGRTPAGFDCSGLVQFAHRQLGLEVPRTADALYRGARPVSLERLEPGDLVFFRIGRSRISHVGIYVSGDLFIHAPSSGKGVSYASLGSSYWSSRLVGAGRYH